jgi:hypothetical protein
MGSVREPGSLAHPQGTPIEGIPRCKPPLAYRQETHAGACQPILVGVYVFFDSCALS